MTTRMYPVIGGPMDGQLQRDEGEFFRVFEDQRQPLFERSFTSDDRSVVSYRRVSIGIGPDVLSFYVVDNTSVFESLVCVFDRYCEGERESSARDLLRELIESRVPDGPAYLGPLYSRAKRLFE